MSVRVAINGYKGRMGQELQAIVDGDGQFEVVAGVDLALGGGSRSLSEIASNQLRDIDVVIDFSLAEGFQEVIKWCEKNKKPLVSGTTGLNDDHFAALDQAAKNIPVLWAPNMSLGVSFVSHLLEQFNAVADQYDFQIEEFHHRHKKDRPSGTAKWLQETLKKSVGKSLPEVMVARGGGVFGVHKVWAFGEEETICIEHTALNRRVFARGALQAAKWLASKKPGRYTISNVLGY